MYDVFGNEIRVGDTVAFAFGGTHKMGTGTVVKIHPKTVSIRYKRDLLKWNSNSKIYEIAGTEEISFHRGGEHVAVYFADSR